MSQANFGNEVQFFFAQPFPLEKWWTVISDQKLIECTKVLRKYQSCYLVKTSTLIISIIIMQLFSFLHPKL